jgi:chorismate synthase
MSSVFGKAFVVATWGESHGAAVGCVVDGCPSGLALSEADIQRELDRRRPGTSEVVSPRREGDRVEILSGVFRGRTVGSPVAMLVRNVDVDSSKYEALQDVARPGHADYTYAVKYGHRDWRGGGRQSARETVGRVAAGAVARKLLRLFGVEVVAYTVKIGRVRLPAGPEAALKGLPGLRKRIDASPVRCPDPGVSKRMEAEILAAKEDGDSVGGVVECVALGLPPGLGEPVFDKLGADLGKALLSLPTVKGVEFGEGFAITDLRGSKSNDLFERRGRRIVTRTNRMGGLLGGISNGMPVLMRAAFKPASSIRKEQETVEMRTGRKRKIAVEGRHDPCVVPRAVPIVEAMVSLVLADHGLRAGVIPRKLA